MPNRDVTTAADLDAMTPAERHADFESRVVTDLSSLPAPMVERIRAKHVQELVSQGRLSPSDLP